MGNADRDFEKAVVVDGVRKTFGAKGEVVALHEVSFEVNRGEVIGLLGPNGAGKTTIVDILSTLSRPDRGRGRSNCRAPGRARTLSGRYGRRRSAGSGRPN